MKTEETTSIARQADYESITNDDVLKWCRTKRGGLTKIQLVIILKRLVIGKYQLFDLRDDILRFKNSKKNA